MLSCGYARCIAATIGVSFEQRCWYPDDGGIVWLSGYELVDAASGRYLARDAPELQRAGLRVASVAGAARHHAAALQSDAVAPGSALELRRDPANEHDPNAVAVHARTAIRSAGCHARVAAILASELDAGRPWSAIALREARRSPRDPRDGLTILLAPAEQITFSVHERRPAPRA